MKIYNLIVCGDNWMSSAIFGNLDDAINEVNKMVEGQKRLEGENNVDSQEIKDYEVLTLPIYMNYGERKYATRTRTLFRGENTTTWRVVFEQEVK